MTKVKINLAVNMCSDAAVNCNGQNAKHTINDTMALACGTQWSLKGEK